MRSLTFEDFNLSGLILIDSSSDELLTRAAFNFLAKLIESSFLFAFGVRPPILVYPSAAEYSSSLCPLLLLGLKSVPYGTEVKPDPDDFLPSSTGTGSNEIPFTAMLGML